MTRQFDQPGRSSVHAANALATTSHPLATTTALTILREGGNAVDAAIAASATLSVVEPHMTGIGGDCFAIVGEPDGSITALNGSGRSPAGTRTEFYLDRGFETIPFTSPHSVTAPGAVRAWETLHTRFGSMDFARLFADAVAHAEEGFPVHARVARDWRLQEPKLQGNEGARRHYLVEGHAPAEGERYSSPALGSVLREIAGGGADRFYRGEIAREIADEVRELGGFLSEEDLAAVESEWVDPVSTEFMGHEIHELPPNTQGVTGLLLLRLLERVGLPPEHDGGARHFMQVELGRLAYSARDTHIADPSHMTVRTQDLLRDEFVDALAARFDPDRRIENLVLPDPSGSDTVYLSVVDRNRMCVSFINSLYSGFGSGIVTRKTGIILQNRGSCFVVKEGHPNCIGPSKRPMHTIIPAMAKRNGVVSICFGVMGGSYQPMGHAHVLANLLNYGMDPQAAIDDPRLFWDAEGTLLAESGISPGLRDHLAARGHRVADGGPHGGGQMIVVDPQTGILSAGSDPRKDGQAGGY